MTDFFDRPQMKRGLLDLNRPKLIQNNAPTPQNSPTHMPKTVAVPAKPHRNEIWGTLLDKRRVPQMDGQLVSEGSHPGVAFRNNDIYVVDYEEYKEPRERQPKFSTS